MTLTNSILHKIISIILFLFFCGCSTQKQSKEKLVTTNDIIKDFLSEFSSINRKKPNAILIRKFDSLRITIEDMPERTFKGYLQESLDGKEIKVGMSDNIICIYYLQEFKKDEIILKDVPLHFLKSVMSTDKIVLNGKEILILNNKMEWQPTFEIVYDLRIKSKTISNHENKVETTKPFPR